MIWSNVFIIICGILAIMSIIVVISIIKEAWEQAQSDTLYLQQLAQIADEASKKATNEYFAELGKKKMRHDKVLKLLQQLRDVSEQQASLSLQLDRPSSNASHSRFKNEIVQKLKLLNEDRTRIMQEIVDSGADPVLRVIMPNGTTNDMKISEIINMHNKPNKTDPITPREKHLRLVKNEDHNESESPSSSKIH